MSSKTLCRLVRLAVLSTAAVALFLVAIVLPLGFAEWSLPWVIFLWAVSLPCFAILVFVWKVSTAIRDETVFTLKTAKWIQTSAIILFADAGFFFVGNLVFLILEMSDPLVFLFFALADIFVIALALLAAVLSRYITKAAVLQEESEGTI